jgi:hypothetical protein
MRLNCHDGTTVPANVGRPFVVIRTDLGFFSSTTSPSSGEPWMSSVPLLVMR